MFNPEFSSASCENNEAIILLVLENFPVYMNKIIYKIIKVLIKWTTQCKYVELYKCAFPNH